MVLRMGTAVAVLALLSGFAAAPYTHAHHEIDSVSDDRHPHGDTLIHTHASPHAHHDAHHDEPAPADHEDGNDRIWSVDDFVFQQPVPGAAPSPVLLVLGKPDIQLTRVWLGGDRPQPKAHGPPVTSPTGLRAPPVFPPTFA